MAINLSDNIKLSAPKLLDDRSTKNGTTPYTSIGEALSIVGEESRARGLFVLIDEGVDGLKLYWFKDGVDDLDLVEMEAGDYSTGLEAIDEGNGIGRRLKGANPDNFGPIGKDAVDLGSSDSASTTVGATGNYSTVSGGFQNTASGIDAAVGGGSENESSGEASNIGGGYQNKSTNYGTAIGGGYYNEASGYYSAVSGGYRNIDSGNYSNIGGGSQNAASGNYSNIGGGAVNEASGDYSTISGGAVNKATGIRSTISGGSENEASGYFATIVGGWLNEASGLNSTVSGGINNLAKTFGEFLGGIWSTIKEGNATTWVGTDRIFGIGNGTSTSSRSDAFNVYKNGVAELPSVTNELIDEADGKAIITKEYLHRKQIKTVSETTYTLLESDWNKILHFTSATDVTITVPTGLSVGNRYEGKQRGEGQLIFIDDGTTTINIGASETNKTLEQFSVFGLDCVASNEYDLFGKLELI